MRILADCVEMERLANDMRQQALALAIAGRACSGMSMNMPHMPAATAAGAHDALQHAHKTLSDVSYRLVRDAGEIYERAAWAEIAGIPGSAQWLSLLLGGSATDDGKTSRVEWDRIVDNTISVLATGIGFGTTARKAASVISQVWRWHPKAVKRSLAARQIRSAGRTTRWVKSRWLGRAGWVLMIVDGIFTFQEHKAAKRDGVEAFVRTAAEVGTPAAAGWGAGLLCIAGLAGTAVSGGATAVLCAGVGAVAGGATAESGLGEWIGQRTEEEFLNPEKYYIQIDVPPEGMTFEEYFEGDPILDD